MAVNLEGFGQQEKEGLFSLAKDMLASWLSKPAEQPTGEWLAENLGDYVGTGAVEIANSIMSDISNFNDSLRQIDEECAAGKSKEEWLKDRLNEVPVKGEQARGEYLSAVNEALAMGNASVHQVLHSETGTISIQEPKGKVEEEAGAWNKYALKGLMKKLIEQTILAGLGGGALSSGIERVTNDGKSLAEHINIFEEATGSEIDTGLKAVAAAALKGACNKGWIPFLTKKTPLCVINTIACWGMESVRTAGLVYTGRMNVAQAVERMGRVSSVAIGDLCVNGVASKFLMAIPVIGPVVGVAVSESITRSANEKVSLMIHEGFKKIQPTVTKMAESAYTAAGQIMENAEKALKKMKAILSN